MQAVLDPFPPSAIINIDTKIDFQFFWPFRRNSSVIVVERPEGPAELA